MSAPVGTTVPAVAAAGTTCAGVLDAIEAVVIGKREALELVLLGILAGGHILLEDLPGLGKTLIARSFAGALGLDFTRVQFTPDLLPSDLTGTSMYDQRSGMLEFRPGPVFTHVLLADEINRTPPKTQSALLEAMGESQVSADGVTRPLPQPFIVLATDNPIEYEGTYPLPEAQLDRFMLRIRLGYLHPRDEAEVVHRRLARGAEPPLVGAHTDVEGVLALRSAVEQVEVDPDLVAYVVALVGATRTHPQVSVGASPRGVLGLVQVARARALLARRDFVTPDDVKAVAVPVLAHRLTVRPELWLRQVRGEDVVEEILGTVPTPATMPLR